MIIRTNNWYDISRDICNVPAKFEWAADRAEQWNEPPELVESLRRFAGIVAAQLRQMERMRPSHDHDC